MTSTQQPSMADILSKEFHRLALLSVGILEKLQFKILLSSLSPPLFSQCYDLVILPFTNLIYPSEHMLRVQPHANELRSLDALGKTLSSLISRENSPAREEEVCCSSCIR